NTVHVIDNFTGGLYLLKRQAQALALSSSYLDFQNIYLNLYTDMSRPELQAPPEIYYGDIEAKKYTNNSRIQQIQADMTYRALELLNLPPDEPAFLLDIGCGSGLSGEILDEQGHVWIGVDRLLLNEKSKVTCSYKTLARVSDFVQEVLMHFGHPMAIKCRDVPSHVLPSHRLMRFFTTLHAALRNPSRAVLQFYPTSDDQVQLITSIAQKAGFGGGIVVDYPNSKKARKVFLCLFVGGGGAQQVPKGLEGEGEEAEAHALFEKRRERQRSRDKSGKRKSIKAKDWILKKKELYRKRGKEGVPNDSKYTGRKRKAVF
ncbi:putative 18S rRNA (guanine-N(7))-methyltransferase, partial [Grifola frondosa]